MDPMSKAIFPGLPRVTFPVASAPKRKAKRAKLKRRCCAAQWRTCSKPLEMSCPIGDGHQPNSVGVYIPIIITPFMNKTVNFGARPVGS